MKKVLIVVDMQNDFVSLALGSKEAKAIVPNVVDKVKYWRLEDKLIFTKDTHYKDYLTTLEGKMLPVKHCIENTSGWMIIPELFDIAVKSKIINKKTFGYEHWFAEFGTADNIEEFELCGLCTDICVISNALALRMLYPNHKITVDASCCAGVTPEKHKAALEVMKSCQINVIGE